MKRLGLFLAALFLSAWVHAVDFGDNGGGGITGTTTSSATITTFQTSTLTVINNATIGSTDSGGDLTIGGGASDTLPKLNLDKDAGGAAQVIFLDQGAQRGQITLDSSEQMVIGTDSNQALLLRTNSGTAAILDTSGRLNLGNTLTNGNSAVNISSGTGGAGSAMFSIGGSTATGSGTLTTVASTPCGSDSIKGILVYIAAHNGVSPTAYYLLACPK